MTTIHYKKDAFIRPRIGTYVAEIINGDDNIKTGMRFLVKKEEFVSIKKYGLLVDGKNYPVCIYYAVMDIELGDIAFIHTDKMIAKEFDGEEWREKYYQLEKEYS